MSFTYTTGIPAAGNNPSVDQPNMQTNTNSINSILAVDHFTFADGNAGRHQYVRMPVGSIPAMSASQAGFYAKTANGFAQLFFTNGVSGNEYQLTRANTTNFASFSTNLPYGAPPATFTQNGGWTFLPGGMLLQYGFYGKAAASGSLGTIQFPVAFTTAPYSVTTSTLSNGANFSNFLIFSTSATSFDFRCSRVDMDGFFWSAIGK